MTEQDLTFMDLDDDLDNLPDLKTAPDGEHRMQIISAEPNAEKGYIKVRLHFPDLDPLTNEVTDFLNFPGPDDDEKRRLRKLKRISNFFKAFEIAPESRKNFADWEGRSAHGVVTTETDANYGDQNRIQKWSGTDS